MIIINIDNTISKTDTIVFEIDIAYVSNLAHACSIAKKPSKVELMEWHKTT